MPQTQSTSSVEEYAGIIRRGFDRYRQSFLEITRRAKGRFETRDWLGTQRDARERLELYNMVIAEVVTEVRAALASSVEDVNLWIGMRAAHAAMVEHDPAGETAETFFNSVTRRIFVTIGVNPSIEYVDFHFQRIRLAPRGRPYRTYATRNEAESTVRTLLQDYAFDVPYANLDRDARIVAQRTEAAWAAGKAPRPLSQFEILEPVFYRRKGAYLVGRVRGGNRVMPFALALVHGADGIEIDAVLHTEDDISVVFSFTRSYFQADVACPSDVIRFLRTLMPVKPLAELYTALGFAKHGKTEFYRDLMRHLARTDEKFEFAPGARGMVMVVFTMPSHEVVFKVIRDSFPYPKQTTPDEVRRRYRLVYAHDRAGRLVDAQAFDGLAFARERFADDLLQELLETASNTVRLEGDQVVIRHLYTERRVRPLDLYLGEAGAHRALRAALDYGQSIKDLAVTNIFPGDFLLKNFGVTRHGRVIFYDYDELSLLSECAFRDIPEAHHPEDELSDEPWFGVGANDIFPEQLIRFLPLSGAPRSAFLDAHGELFTAAFWRELQQRAANGEVLNIRPYRDERRLSVADEPSG